MAEVTRLQPCRRADFRIAIICALKVESDAVEALFDQKWNATALGKAQGDPNTYSVGRIGLHNVVLAFMPGIGNTRSAATAAALRTSFVNVSLGLVVGVCGANPKTANGNDIFLGDIIISTRVVHSDFGRQYSDSIRIKATEDGLARPGPAISSFLAMLSGVETEQRLADKTAQHLSEILQKRGFEKSNYPGPERDRLYNSNYRHRHRPPHGCVTCAKCKTRLNPVCDEASRATCGEVGCSEKMRLSRVQRANSAFGANDPKIYQGTFASSSQVIRSAFYRNELFREHRIIGLEMEGAGTWDNFPCILVKGVCDYADSHKDKKWQRYSAVAAAACAKAMLAEWIAEDSEESFSNNNNVASAYEIPYDPTDIPVVGEFVGRDTELARITSILCREQKSLVDCRQVFVIHGLGGIGKTQIAARFARTNKSKFSAIFWIDGSTIESVNASLARLATRVKLAQDVVKADNATQAMLAWLARPGNTEWLMIFDNIDLDVDAKVPDPQAYRVDSFFPPADHGSILITSRLQSMYRLGTYMEIQKLSLADSTSLVEQYLDQPLEKDDQHLRTVLQRLDGLPLALATTASFFRATDMTFKEYNLSYDENWSELIDQQVEAPLPEYGKRSMATTWRLSYNNIKSQNEDATHLLKLMAFLNPTQMDYNFFKHAFEFQTEGKWAGDWIFRVCRSKLAFSKCTRLLLQYSFIQKTRLETGFSMHGVVHEWIYHYVVKKSPIEEYQLLCALVYFLIDAQIVTDIGNADYWPVNRALAPHANTLSRRITSEKIMESPPPEFLITIASLLTACSILAYPEALYLQAQKWVDETSDADPNLVLELLDGLGCLYKSQSKLDDAEEVLYRAFEGRKEILGADHESTLNTLNSLGDLYLRQGKLEMAEMSLARALQGMEEHLNFDHPSISFTVNDLGLVYLAQGKLNKAEAMFERALRAKERNFYCNHESTLGTETNLALVYEKLGQLEDAEKLYRRVIQGLNNSIGPEHKMTLEVVNNLGVLQISQGKFDDAEKSLQQALEGAENVFGLAHMSTFGMLNNLGSVYIRQNRLDDAEKMLDRACKGKEKVLGPKHPSTLITVRNLGLIYAGQGNFEDAEKMLERALRGKTEVLGAQHASTIATQQCLDDLRVRMSEVA